MIQSIISKIFNTIFAFMAIVFLCITCLKPLEIYATDLSEPDTMIMNISSHYAGGDGSENSPFQISTVEQLLFIAEDMSAENDEETLSALNYILINDIEVTSWDGIKAFYGVFDGGGYTISGLTNCFIGHNSGVIKNLHLKSCAITFQPIINAAAGIIAVVNTGIIENVYAYGEIKINGPGCIGLLVGNNEEGTILDSYAEGIITINKHTFGGATYYEVGGLVGYDRCGKISGCGVNVIINGSSGITVGENHPHAQ